MLSRVALLGFLLLSAAQAEAHSISKKNPSQAITPPLRQYFQEIEVIDKDIGSDAILVRGVIDKFKLWPVGRTLTVCFLASDPQLKAFFVDAAKDWSDGTSIYFDFGDAPSFRPCGDRIAADIKVGFLDDGNWSYVGTDSLRYSSKGITLNVGDASGQPFDALDKSYIKGVILHELGHALGLEHEHQSPESQCETEFDWPTVEAYAKKYWSWGKEDVDRNLRALTSSERLATTPYDSKSIMHYYFEPEFFKAGTSSPCYVGLNQTLSDVDRQAIVSSYPPEIASAGSGNLAGPTSAAGIALASLQLSRAQLGKVGQRIGVALDGTGHTADLEIELSTSTLRGPGDVEPCGASADVECLVAKDASALLISVKSADRP